MFCVTPGWIFSSFAASSRQSCSWVAPAFGSTTKPAGLENVLVAVSSSSDVRIGGNILSNLAVIQVLPVGLLCSQCSVDERPTALLRGPRKHLPEPLEVDLEEPPFVPHNVCSYKTRVDNGRDNLARLCRLGQLFGELADDQELDQLGDVVSAQY